MKVLVLGADGYLGWPTCMHLSKKGHEIMGIDNYFRRTAAMKLDSEALVPTPNLTARAKVWNDVSGLDVAIQIGDITDYEFLRRIFEQFRPQAVIHYAEQPSAPFSMIGRDEAAFTLQNNLVGTLNLAYAVKEVVPDCHIVKLGTMGEYGTPEIDIEEGWIDIEHKGRQGRFLFPRAAGSLYHTTKVQDTDLLWFYVRAWGLRVTDLMQGPVYGLSTEETSTDERLMPNFHYDEIFGTVLNRFVVQAVAGYPLTVYGKGGQTRGYLNLVDTMQCIHLAVQNPVESGDLRVLNQFTETFSVNELADRVKRVGDRLGYSVKIDNLANPRIEKEEHYYNPTYTGLLELGLEPHFLTDEIVEQFFEVTAKHRKRINRDAIFRGISWK